MKLVITQSMLFPWVGLLEQIRAADILVFYDDVQFSKGSFTNRVQIKTEFGIKWMTVPLQNLKLSQVIDEVKTAPIEQWREKHMALLDRSLSGTPFKVEALSIARDVYSVEHISIGHLARSSMLALCEYFDLLKGKKVYDVRELSIEGSGSARVLSIVRALGCSVYLTGHGARNYIDHNAFEQAGIQVQYMKYKSQPYPQLWGNFTPYVTGLDLVANLGLRGKDKILSTGIPWKEFLSQ